MGCGVEAKVADLDHDRPLTGGSAGERAQPREQLLERERLHQVVVGAGVEPFDAIIDCVASRQHQHRRPHILVAQSPANVEAVQAGQHHVEDDCVVRRRLRHPQPFFATPCGVGDVAFLAETAYEQLGELRLVLHDQHTHVRIVLAACQPRASRIQCSQGGSFAIEVDPVRRE